MVWEFFVVLVVLVVFGVVGCVVGFMGRCVVGDVERVGVRVCADGESLRDGHGLFVVVEEDAQVDGGSCEESIDDDAVGEGVAE